MRKRILAIVVCLLLFAPQVYGYTVTVNFLNTSSVPYISGLQFDFLGNVPGTNLPLDLNYSTYGGDFNASLGSAVGTPAGWNVDNLISSVGDPVVTADYVKGMSFSTKAMNPSLAPTDGLFVTMDSTLTNFRIDLSSFEFYDFTDPYGEVITTPFSVVQVSDGSGTQVSVDFASVPIPGAIWLLGSGLLGLVTIRRRRG